MNPFFDRLFNWHRHNEPTPDDRIDAEVEDCLREHAKTVQAAQAASIKRSETLDSLRRTIALAKGRTEAWAEIDDFVTQHTHKVT